MERFVERVGGVLREAASGTAVASDPLERDVAVEAFNLSCAVIDADQRHGDDELWALVAAFAPRDLIPAGASPTDLRASSLLDGRRSWLQQQSELFSTLVEVDRQRGTRASRAYYDEAGG